MRNIKIRHKKGYVKKNIIITLLITFFGLILGSLLKTGFASTEDTLVIGDAFNKKLKSLVSSKTISSNTVEDNTLTFLKFDSYSDEKYGLNGSVIHINWEDGINVDTTNEGHIKLFYDKDSSSAYVLAEMNYEIFFNANSQDMFRFFKALIRIDFNSIINTSKVTNMNNMFYGCENLQNIDLSNFDTSQVQSMSLMFAECKEISELDVSMLNTSNVKNMNFMFSRCNNIKNITLSNFNTENVTDMSAMFNECTKLQSLDLSSFITINVTNMANMFYGCSSLVNINLEKFYTANVTNMKGMFYGCTLLNDLNLTNFDTSKVNNMRSMFNNCLSLNKLDLSSFNTSKVTDMSFMFSSCENIIELNLSNFNTSKVTNIRCMFSNCKKLKIVDVSSFDVSLVTEMDRLFYNCSSLEYIDLSNFNTSSVINMYEMFSECSSIKYLDLSSFNTSKVKEVYGMFYNCKNLQKLDICNFDISNVTNLINLFKGCSNLKILDLSSFNTSQVNNMSYMFSNCENLETIFVAPYDDITKKGWNNTNLINSFSMFYKNDKLVGGYGTLPNPLEQVDHTFAVIDSLIQRGYFTLKQDYDYDLKSIYTLNSNRDVIINFSPKIHYVTSTYIAYENKKIIMEENKHYSIVDGKLVLNSNFLNNFNEGNYELYIQNKDSLEENIINLNLIKEYLVTIKSLDEVINDKNSTITISKINNQSIKITANLGFQLNSITINGERKKISGQTIDITATEDSEIIVGTLPIQYKIVEGDNHIYTLASKENLTIKANGPLELFDSLEVCREDVCDKLVLNQDYSIGFGSTIITLASEYLEELNSGKYILKINYSNGTNILGSFEVKKTLLVDNIITNTGDTITKCILIFIVSFIAFITLTFIIFKNKKQDIEII